MNIDWNYYLSSSFLTEKQGACLLFECDPNLFKEDWQLNDNPFIIKPKFKRLDESIKMKEADRLALINNIDNVKSILRRDIYSGVITPENSIAEVNYDPLDDDVSIDDIAESRREEYYFKPAKFIIWAISKGNLHIPVKMMEFLKNSEPPASRENNDVLRAEHVRDWVTRTQYTGGKYDEAINTELRNEKPELWGETLGTFRKWIQTEVGKEVKNLLPNKHRK